MHAHYFGSDNLQVGVWKHPTSGDGRLTHEVLPADLTRLPRSAPGRQVKVTVAGVTAQCTADCDITYDADLNAAVTDVSSEIGEQASKTSFFVYRPFLCDSLQRLYLIYYSKLL